MEESLFEFNKPVIDWDWSMFHPVTLPIKIKKNNNNAKLPEHGSAAAAGYDVFACIDDTIELPPHTTTKIGTGFSMQIPPGFWIGVFARSGLATKKGLRPANCVGE